MKTHARQLGGRSWCGTPRAALVDDKPTCAKRVRGLAALGLKYGSQKRRPCTRSREDSPGYLAAVRILNNWRDAR